MKTNILKILKNSFEMVTVKLERVIIIEERAELPMIDDVLYKFRGVSICEHVMRDIVEFAQGKAK